MAKKKKKTVNNAKSKKKSAGKSNSTSPRDKIYQKEILAFMKENRKQSFTSKQVGAATGLYSEIGMTKVRAMMQRLAESGKLEPLSKGSYRYLKQDKSIVGQIEVTRRGSGYILQEGDDIFVRSQDLGKALNGDMVKARIIKKRRSGQQEAKIVEIVQRARTEFVGTIEEGIPGTYFFLPDDSRISTDFFIPEKHLKGAKDGQKVLIRLLNWDRKSPEGEVLEVLGDAGDHSTEMHAILYQYGFNPSFPPEVEKEARNIPEQLLDREIKRRRDMREVLTLTIDPEDAKDFDDALSFQVLENGHYEVGIHIADVSYYVRPDSFLDKEAFKRATSVYLVDRTVPMLPEKLSNGVCSLRPHEDKFTYAAIFEMDDEAKIHKQWIGRTVIHSDHRFSYEEAQENIIGNTKGPFAEPLIQLNKLALKLRGNRMKQGSIEFDTEEVKFVLDENDKPIAVKRKERFDAHKLIEDFMLLANRKVAQYIAEIFKNPPLPSIYRVHDTPSREKLGVLQNFVKQFGYKTELAEAREVSSPLNALLSQVQGKPEQNVIETLAVRSMAKAEYSTQNLGHFGLGFEFYTHFTSPIRRYPDLLIHRILYHYQKKEYNQNQVVLEEQCKHCSKRERTAAEAERASIKYKQVEFLEDKIGKEYNGIISGVIESGVFIELEENLCEGMVHIKTLEDDYYSYEAEMYQLVGVETGNVYRIGDKVRVEIAGVDLKRRTIDMKMVGKQIA